MKLAIGTAQFGMEYGIANQSGKTTQKEISSILSLACDNGINTVDTAKAYGNSEEAIGKSLDDKEKSQWNIITKVDNCDGSIAEMILDSANKLTIKPHALLAHSSDLFLHKKFREELIFSKKDNLVSKIGVSIYNEKEINQIMLSDLIPDIIQVPINILDTRLYRSGKLKLLKEKGVEIHARSIFLQGLFFLEKDLLTSRFPEVLPAIEKLRLIASEAEVTLPELSLLWLASLGEVDKIIIGIDNTKQLKAHLMTIKKTINPDVFNDALSICFENESILNPSLWK